MKKLQGCMKKMAIRLFLANKILIYYASGCKNLQFQPIFLLKMLLLGGNNSLDVNKL